MDGKVRIIRIGLAACFPVLVSLAQLEEPVLPGPGRIGIGASAGDGVEEYRLEALVPVWKPGNAIVFLNPRGVFLEDRDQEAGLGLVARRRWDRRDLILGANAYFDTRWTEAGNRFEQVGGGVELLSRWFDLRGGYYYPLTDEKTLGASEESVSTVENNRRVNVTTVYREVEEALEGLELEAGIWVPWLSRHLPTGVFVGYEDFDSDFDTRSTEGLRVRLEARPHPNLTLDVAWFEEDTLARSEYFIGLRLNLPLDFRKGLRLDRAGAETVRVPPFEQRMSDPVQRTFRIRTVLPGPVAVSSRRSEAAVAPPPEPVCYTDWVLDEEGNLVPIQICE